MIDARTKQWLFVLTTLSPACVGSVEHEAASEDVALADSATVIEVPIDAERADTNFDDTAIVDSAPERADTPPTPKTVALFVGAGAGAEYVSAVGKVLAGDPRFVLVKFSDGAADFGKFDVVVMPGGSASAEWKTLGSAGQSKLKAFVSSGGGYVGICAGFYLALPGNAGLIQARFYEPWARGEGEVSVELATKNSVFSLGGTHRFRYVNGPIVYPIDTEAPGYTVLARFAGNIGSSDLVSMVGKPAVVAASYGAGRVVAFSPHPELSGLGQLLKDSLLWAAR